MYHKWMKISALDWDDDNIAKIARHGISPEEVEDVCYGRHIPRKDPASKSNEKIRYILAGQANDGVCIDVVVEKIGAGWYRPVTAFPMSENYIRKFKQKMGKGG